MAKFLLGILAGILLTGLVLVILFFAALRLSEKPPSIAGRCTLVLTLDGEIPERAPVTLPLPFFEERAPLTVTDVWRALRQAETDPRIQGAVLTTGRVAAGWAKLEEIHAALLRFRRTGKPLVAFLRSPGTREYYLATAAGQVYMPPEDMLDLKGLRAELMFFRKTLDKIGVQVEVEHAGKYKDYGDMFTRSSMSPETREVLNSVLDDLYTRLLRTLAEGRRKPLEQIRAIVDDGPFLSRQALAKGLVDGLLYEDEVYGELKKRLGGLEVKKLSCRDYLKAVMAAPDGGRRVALLVAEGDILSGTSDAFSDENAIRSGDFIKLLRQVGSDASLRGVIVRIDSPGGSSFASDEIWREMNVLSRKKPLVISMSDAAASGGYYIAMTGDPIVAQPGTFTGSIGVIFGKINLRGLYDKLGIQKEYLARGRFATIDSDYEPLSEAARKKLREGIDDNYRGFVQRVADARKRKFGEVEPLAQGRVWLGSQARERGLVDELGGLDRALELVRRKARIPAAEKVTLVMYPPRRTIFERLMTRSAQNLSGGGDLGALLRKFRATAWFEGGMMKRMPYGVEIR